MATEIITKEDLELFRVRLLADLKQYVNKREAVKQWLKSSEVRRLLKISPATLQTLRIKGALPATKVGGVHYYRYEDIEKMMEQPAG